MMNESSKQNCLANSYGQTLWLLCCCVGMVHQQCVNDSYTKLVEMCQSGKLSAIFRSLVKSREPLHWVGRAMRVTPYGWRRQEWEGKQPCCISYRMSVTVCRSAVRQTAEKCVLHWRVTARRQSHTAAVTATRLLSFQLVGNWLV